MSGPLERSGTRIFAWNTDAWGYSRSTSSLYQSHPWVLAVLPDGSALGVLADTTRKCEVRGHDGNTGRGRCSTVWMSGRATLRARTGLTCKPLQIEKRSVYALPA